MRQRSLYIEGKYTNCECSDCEEEGCSLDLTGLSNQVQVLDMDCVKRAGSRPGRICDCGILWKHDALIAAVELKGGLAGLSTAKLVEQIQKGLDALYEVVDGQPVSEFYPILLFRKGNLNTRRALNQKRYRVRFRNQPRYIIAGVCGSNLADLVKARH